MFLAWLDRDQGEERHKIFFRQGRNIFQSRSSYPFCRKGRTASPTFTRWGTCRGGGGYGGGSSKLQKPKSLKSGGGSGIRTPGRVPPVSGFQDP